MKEKLQAKLDSLVKEREGVLANLNAYNGAVEVLKQLIADEVAKETAPGPAASPVSQS